jgi:hypothetical protein
MQLAFVIKNHIPYSFKVVLLHQKYGKIIGIFSKNDQAALLTSGSLIWCSVEKKHNVFMITHVEIESEISMHNLSLVHDIMKLCLHRLPSRVSVPELFDFLLYVRGHIDQFCSKAEKIVMLRLFLMLDLLDQDALLYSVAILDPMGKIECDNIVLEKYVASGWDNFYKMQLDVFGTQL